MAVQAPPIWIARTVEPQLRLFLSRLFSARFPPEPGLLVTSWYRDPEWNQAVGGASASQHLAGLAIDVAGLQNPAAFARAFEDVGLVTIVYDRHVHIQSAPAGELARLGWRV